MITIEKLEMEDQRHSLNGNMFEPPEDETDNEDQNFPRNNGRQNKPPRGR